MSITTLASGTSVLHPPYETPESAILGWLRGEVLPELSGKRVMLFTYGDSGYFGIKESPEFVTRYQLESGVVQLAPLNKPCKSGDEQSVREIGLAIKALAVEGRLVQLPTPQAYEGAAVLYALRA